MEYMEACVSLLFPVLSFGKYICHTSNRSKLPKAVESSTSVVADRATKMSSFSMCVKTNGY